MPLHRLSAVHVRVARYAEFCDFYRRFGLEEIASGRFASARGGQQLHVEPGDRNTVVEIVIGADAPSDLDAVGAGLQAAGHTPERPSSETLLVAEPTTGITIRVTVEPRVPAIRPRGGIPEVNRAELVGRARVRPQRLGHMVLGCPDVDAVNRFFTECLGMRISDEVIGAVFLRFDTDHHNLAFLRSDHTWLHHMAWKVGSVDEVGYGAMQLIDHDQSTNCYGLGRHAASANYFWYLRDPSGSLAEYYHSEFDDLVDDAEFWNPVPNQAPMPVASWGPSLPPTFFAPTGQLSAGATQPGEEGP